MKILSLSIICLFVFSCGSSEAYDEVKCYESVQKKYKNCVIFSLPDNSWKFVVADTSKNLIYYVEAMDSYSTKVTSEIVISGVK